MLTYRLWVVAAAWAVCELAQSARADLPAAPSVSTLSPFGIGSDYHSGLDLTKWIPQMAELGIPMIRTCQPDQMDYLTRHHMKFGGLLYGVPDGDKIDPPGSLPVKDLATWSASVTKRVRGANGRVKYWEVWNEPPNGIGSGQTAGDYAKLMVSTYDAAHAVDPDCLVGLAAKSVHVNWLEQTIKAGAKNHFDYIVLHPYETLGLANEHAGTEPVFMNIVPTVRKMLAAQDPAKKDVPIIFTELGFDADKGADLQAFALVKAYTMGIAQGVNCIEWFEGIDGDSGPMGMLQGNGKPRPSYMAMGQMIQQLGLHPEYLGWVMLNDRDYAFCFNGAKSTVLITWAPLGSKDKVSFSGEVEVVNPLTARRTKQTEVELDSAPVIILGVPNELIALAKLNKGKALPWGGDYAKAKSVSVSFGETNKEEGLHTQSAQSIAADVIAYGGSARAGSVPGGNVFMVDPQFLTYDSDPIEISITVRRNAANDNAGFKLEYESTNGMKNKGWYTVPDNKEWHTVKWKITDAEFVSMYGFNFALNSDGYQFDKYDIQSVVVTKLEK